MKKINYYDRRIGYQKKKKEENFQTVSLRRYPHSKTRHLLDQGGRYATPSSK